MTTFDVPKFICFKIYTLIKAIFFGVLTVIDWLAGTSNQSKSHGDHALTADVSTSTIGILYDQLPKNHSKKQIYDTSHLSTTDSWSTDTQKTKHLSGQYEKKIYHDHKQHCKATHKKCGNPSCKEMRWRDSYGYCSTTCMKRHRNSSHQVIRRASLSSFQNVEEYFIKRWHRNKGTCGKLKEVLIINNPKLQGQFERYLSMCLDKTVFMCYHGTSLRCSIYDNIATCGRKICGVCGIINNGFQEKFISANITYQRFGDAFYFAVNSSKSHDYTQGHGECRAMLLCKVAVGKRFITRSNHCDLSAPPSGYDSVYGKHGGTLNYDEIVVYNPEAVLPTHVLIYKKDGIDKIAR